MIFHRWQSTFFASLLVLAVSGMVSIPSSAPSAGELAQSSDVMQCMEKCIRSEGKAEKATCKTRCANVSSQRPKQKDCMGIYKSCNRDCNKDKACKRSCKQNLMNCS